MLSGKNGKDSIFVFHDTGLNDKDELTVYTWSNSLPLWYCIVSRFISGYGITYLIFKHLTV